MKKKLLFLIPAFVGMSVFAQVQQRVGVNTTAPQATLDINGNMAIEKAESPKDTDELQQLTWNSGSYKVEVKPVAGKLFYILDYVIEAYESDAHKSQKRQWLSDFDTKIPSDEYNVVFSTVSPTDRDKDVNFIDMMHAQGQSTDDVNFGIATKIYPIDPDNGYGGSTGHYQGRDKDADRVNSIVRKVLWKNVNTKSWHFTVGFPGGRPDNGGVWDHRMCIEWHVRLIAIPKSSSAVVDINSKVDFVSKSEGGEEPRGQLDTNPMENIDK